MADTNNDKTFSLSAKPIYQPILIYRLIPKLYRSYTDVVSINFLARYTFFSIEKIQNDFENTYSKLTFVHDETYWQKYIYKIVELTEPTNHMDCSFICRNIEKPNGKCDLFLMMVIKSLFILEQRFIPIIYNLHTISLGKCMLYRKIRLVQ